MTQFKFLVHVVDQANYFIPAAAVFSGIGVAEGDRGTLGQNELVVFQRKNNKPPYQTPTTLRLGVCGTLPVWPPWDAREEEKRRFYDRLLTETVVPSQTGTDPGQRRYPTYPTALTMGRLPVEVSKWQGITPTQLSNGLAQVYFYFTDLPRSCPVGSLSDLYNVWRVTDIHVTPYS